MRKISTTILLFLIGIIVSNSQVPEKFNYQGILRNSEGELIQNTNIRIKITLLEGSATGTESYTETHDVQTGDNGQFAIQVGDGSEVSGDFSLVNWASGQVYIKTEVDESGGSIYTTLGTVQLITVPYSLLSKASNTSMYSIKADTANIAKNFDKDVLYFTDTDTLFAVKDREGNIVFAVFPDGAEIYVNETAKGKVGGFAISGRSPSKANGIDILRVTVDSTRIYVSDTMVVKGKVGGFAISGRSPSKGAINDYFTVNRDSTRVYVNEDGSKGKVGGFAISGRSPSKGVTSKFMNMTKDNYFIGHEAGKNNTSGIYNSFLGYQAGYSNTSAFNNVFIGYVAGYSNTEGSFNSFLGFQAGYANTTGQGNVFIGYDVGHSNTDGHLNSFLGYQAGYSNTIGQRNVFIGGMAGFSNLTGNGNVFIGEYSGQSNLSGYANVFLGRNSGIENTEGNRNTFVGPGTGALNISGSYNSFFGYNAGLFNKTGTNNVYIGAHAGYLDSLGSGNVFLGYYAGASETGSEKLYIDNKDRDSSQTLIFGDFLNRYVRMPRLGIGKHPVAYNLEVEGSAYKTDGSTLWTTTSDKRIKTDIRDIENSFETILKLRPVKYKYTEEWKKKNPSLKDQYYYNFIAQDYQEVFPESVSKSGEYLDGDPNEILTINTQNAQIVTIKAVQELIKENTLLHSDVEQLKTENQELKQKLNEIIEMLSKE